MVVKKHEDPSSTCDNFDALEILMLDLLGREPFGGFGCRECVL